MITLEDPVRLEPDDGGRIDCYRPRIRPAERPYAFARADSDGEEIFASRIRALPGEHAARIRFLLIGDEIVEGVREEDRLRLVCDSHFEVVAGRDYRFEVRLPRAVQTRGSVTRYRHTIDPIEAPESRRIITRPDCRWDLD